MVFSVVRPFAKNTSMSIVPKNGRVAVIGGGISGLSFSYFLSKIRPDVHIDIYEKTQRTGGWINSRAIAVNLQPVVLEKGPRTLRGVSDGTLLIIDIMKQLGQGDQVDTLSKLSVANKKYIVNEDKEIVQVPDNLLSAARFTAKSGIVDTSVVKGLLAEPWVKRSDKDETIEAFFRRRFGSGTLTSKVLSAVIHGIYAGDVEKLSVRAILPQLVKLEKEDGSIIRAIVKNLLDRSPKPKESLLESLQSYEQMISPRSKLLELSQKLKQYPMLKLQDGLEAYPNALTKYLEKIPQVQFIYGADITEVSAKEGTITNATGIQKYNHIRSTINVNELNSVLREKNANLNLHYVSIYLVNIYAPKSMGLIPRGKNGFGFLVPKHGSQQNTNANCLLGVIYDSDVEKHVNKLELSSSKSSNELENYEKITLMMGGHYFDDTGVPSKGIRRKMLRNILTEYLHLDLSKVNLVFTEAEAGTDVKLADDCILVLDSVHENCIPQYGVGYVDARKAVLDNSQKEKLSFGGMAFGNGVGVPDCVVNAFEGALKLR